MRFKLIGILFLCITSLVSSQTKTDDVLFTIENEPVMASEFLRVYNKNLDLVKDESQKEIDGYLKLFIDYKLKLKAARDLEFDKKPNYIREFQGYKKQLTKNYLTDHKVTDDLVKEAYNRVSQDVKVNHVLIRLQEHETDTAQIYNQMLTFRKRLQTEDFENLKKNAHNGNTVFAEELGYFSGFKMVYEFENVAFNTPVGEVSMPFRTQFGYHVLKVYDKRQSRGSVTVGHIMLMKGKEKEISNPTERIQEIYKLIQQGQDFESLAKQFSEDQSSAKKGGKLTPFKSGQLSSVAFEDKAFAMQNPGDISRPFKTDYGWHIIKLYEKEAIKPFEKMKGQLENRVKRDSRSKLIKSAFIESLKVKYKVNVDKADLPYFVNLIDESYYQKKWRVPTGFNQERPFVKIGDKSFTYFDFAKFLQKAQKRIREKLPLDAIVKLQFDSFLNETILKYHEDNLEKDNQEYAQVINEYREGLLLFDLMETKIWNAVKEDTVGLQNYYNQNKNSYVWPKRIDAIVATSSKKENIEKVKKALKKGTDAETIKAELNTDGKQNVIFTKGIMAKGDQSLSDDVKFKKGVSNIYSYNDAYHVILVNDVLPSKEKAFEEAKGNVISDYQGKVEKDWLESLHSKYKIIINESVLNKVKSQINN